MFSLVPEENIDATGGSEMQIGHDHMIFLFTRKHKSQLKVKTQIIFLKPHNGYKMLQIHFWGKGRKNHHI